MMIIVSNVVLHSHERVFRFIFAVTIDATGFTVPDSLTKTVKNKVQSSVCVVKFTKHYLSLHQVVNFPHTA